MQRAEKELNLPLPEMTFGNNLLSLSYASGSDSGEEGSRITLSFNGLEALAEVGTGEGWEDRTGGAVLVSMAETWGKNRYVCNHTSHLAARLHGPLCCSLGVQVDTRAGHNLVNCLVRPHSLPNLSNRTIGHFRHAIQAVQVGHQYVFNP